MNLYLVRAGKYGEREKVALEKGFVAIGWNELSNLSRVKTKEQMEGLFTKTFPNLTKNQTRNYVAQIWIFVNEISRGDLVALPLKSQSAIAIGEVLGNYEFNDKITEGVKHIRKVKWLKTIPRFAFDQDLLYSLGAFMTVCKISRNDAVKRIQKLLRQKSYEVEEVESVESSFERGNFIVDVEEFGRAQVVQFISQKFKGHGLARLVDAVLRAEGYYTLVSPPGPDGGVDILAAKGSTGFDQPRLCVQVKSSTTPADVRILRELQGVMTKIRADHGLLVAWGGYNGKAAQEARDAFFSIRLWDAGNLLEAIFKYYDKFDDELKAELPLKRIWG